LVHQTLCYGRYQEAPGQLASLFEGVETQLLNVGLSLDFGSLQADIDRIIANSNEVGLAWIQ